MYKIVIWICGLSTIVSLLAMDWFSAGVMLFLTVCLFFTKDW